MGEDATKIKKVVGVRNERGGGCSNERGVFKSVSFFVPLYVYTFIDPLATQYYWF